MSIFPFVEFNEENTLEDLPLAKEWAWDFEANDFKTNSGKMYLVEGLEAVLIWVQKALITKRFKYPVYSWNYGSELESLIGSDYSPAATIEEVKRYISEAVMTNPYVIAVSNFDVKFAGDTISVTFHLETIYGESEVKVSV